MHSTKQQQVKRSYLLQVLSHKWFIIVAGLRVGGFPFWRLLIHDWSKFLPSEYFAYRRRFTGEPVTDEEWDRAWLHHIHFSPHHHEHWMIKNRAIPMPALYAREMVIDWFAASRSYKGSWNIQRWLDKKFNAMNLHPDTVRIIQPILESQGFTIPKAAA